MATFEERLKIALKNNNMKQIDLANKLKMNRAIISQYLSGRYKPKYDRISEIASALNVSEAWLMGYDVEPLDDYLKKGNDKVKDELDELFDHVRDDLTEVDIELMKMIMKRHIKEIDNELDNEGND